MSRGDRAVDIEYESVEHVMEEVKAMKVRGGSAFGCAAASAFLLVARKGSYSSGAALIEALEEVANALMREKPTMATIYNARRLMVDSVKRSMSGADAEAVAREVIRRAEAFIRHSREAVDRIGSFGASLVGDGDTIMMHSFSGSIMSVFRAARDAGKRFRVICTESRPLRESRYAVNVLTELGVPVIFITDASMWEFVRKADWVLVGADTIAYDGSVANKMGTALLARLCALAEVPFFVASEIAKLDPRTRDGRRIDLEMRPVEEVVSPGDFRSMNGVAVVNQFFDITPARDIRGIITERGVVPPNLIAVLWHEFEEELTAGLA